MSVQTAMAGSLGLLLCVPGCTVVNVYEDGIRTERQIGLFSNSPAKALSGAPAYIETRGLGVVPGAHGLSIGYMEETTISLADTRCVAVFIKPTRETMDALTAAGVDLTRLCTYP